MPRKGRERSETGIYHVMLRGINRQDIFEEPDDYWAFIKILSTVQTRFADDHSSRICTSHIHAYCLMPNHIHLLLCEKEWDLGEVVKSIAASYALFYNKKYGRIGHLFQDRFKSEPVNDQGYFFTLLRYIHQNPMAAGLSKGIDDYEWSSWKEYENYRIGLQDICTVKHVTARMPIDELRDFVADPLPKTIQILDFDDGKVNLTDDEVKEFLSNTFGLKQTTDLQLYNRERRNDILREAKQYGASIRQLVRLTGISFAIVRDA